MVDYMADFETTTDPDDCRVWGFAICRIDDPENVQYGNNLTDFCELVSELEEPVIYFHNLKFDGHFIVDWLFQENYLHTTKRDPPNGHFTSLISQFGKWYQIIIKWKNGKKCELRDSSKKIPLSVSAMAKAFKLDEIKGEINYHAKRELGHILTANEMDYMANDVTIPARSLSLQLNAGATKLTIGADSLTEYKNIMGPAFKKLFPVLEPHVDSDIRSAYRGGWCMLKPGVERKAMGAGHVFDVNSLYPHVMYSSVLPYGQPEQFKGPPDRNDLWVASITFTARIKENHLPCIQLKKSWHFAATEYVPVIEEPETVSITSVDYELWMQHYDIDIHAWNGGYYFTSATGLFEKYIDKWSKVKAESEGGMREIAKLHLNSLYGKFATSPDVTGKIPYYENRMVKLAMGTEETRDSVYTAMGAFITSYARKITISAAQAHYDVFAYADTDSLHLVTSEPVENMSLDIDQTRMGAWKHEYSFTSALYLRPKAYSEHKCNGKWETRIAGLPRHITKNLTSQDLVPGRVFHGKLTPKSVRGGVVLVDTEYTLKV